MFRRLLKESDEAIDFFERLPISRHRVDFGSDDRIHEDGQGLRHAIEDEEFVGDEKIERGGIQFVPFRPWHDRFHVVNEFVADKADGSTREPRQPRQCDRPKLIDNSLDHL